MVLDDGRIKGSLWNQLRCGHRLRRNRSHATPVLQKNQANPIFIWQLLWNPEIRRQIKEKSGGTSGTMHNISKQKLLEIKCIDVPANEQNNFADFVKQVDKSKVAVQKAIDETQLLFDSLMQKYFG